MQVYKQALYMYKKMNGVIYEQLFNLLVLTKVEVTTDIVYIEKITLCVIIA